MSLHLLFSSCWVFGHRFCSQVSNAVPVMTQGLRPFTSISRSPNESCYFFWVDRGASTGVDFLNFGRRFFPQALIAFPVKTQRLRPFTLFNRSPNEYWYVLLDGWVSLTRVDPVRIRLSVGGLRREVIKARKDNLFQFFVMSSGL